MAVSQNLGYPLGGAHNKDYRILGVYIGVPLFWETTIYTPPFPQATYVHSPNTALFASFGLV